MKKFTIFVISIVFLLTIVTAYNLFSSLDENKYYVANVHEIRGSYLRLGVFKIVRLAGVTIPFKADVNFSEKLQQNIERLLLNKNIKFKTILKRKEHNEYPDVDLVFAYLNDVNINDLLLREGKGFFSFDYFNGSKKRQKLELDARKKIGIWKSSDKLKPIFVTSSFWRFLHYPDCPKSKKIPENKKIYYYVKPPYMLRGKYLADFHCAFCNKKYYANHDSAELENPFGKLVTPSTLKNKTY